MTALRRILLPTDGTAEDLPAIREAMRFAALLDASVTALHAVDSSGLGALPGTSQGAHVEKALEAAAARAFEHVRAEASRAGVPLDARLARGNPPGEIVKAAAGFDLVVMGTHGRAGVEHFLAGSYAEAVVRDAPCPVLVVRLRR